MIEILMENPFSRFLTLLILFIVLFVIVLIIRSIAVSVKTRKTNKLESKILKDLGFYDGVVIPNIDATVNVKSRQTLDKYDAIKYFKESGKDLEKVKHIIQQKSIAASKLRGFLEKDEYNGRPLHREIKKRLNAILENEGAYRIEIKYITRAGNCLAKSVISVTYHEITELQKNPYLFMNKTEAVSQKQKTYYDNVNAIIDYANKLKGHLLIKGDQEKLDNLISRLFDKTVNSIKKVKSINSEEWKMLGDFILSIRNEVKNIADNNQKIYAYYSSPEFLKIKETCGAMMSSQREFNEYINKKVQTIATLFGTRVVRNETDVDDEYNYIRPYKKTITPFTAEVSAAVFGSAENKPLEYVVKYFYPDKSAYPEQIKKLQLLVEELYTLKEAKEIIENYKKEYQQYIVGVPSLVMENDAAGFYSRLGFANIDDSLLTVEYKFVYTSNGGMAQRSFTVSMTEDTILELIKMLESKLTASAFAKEQRLLMTKKLREFIKNRDNYTCCICGNSTHAEPNLLLEIDHIIPVAKGGITEESNLQTLCWKCNRSKGDKII